MLVTEIPDQPMETDDVPTPKRKAPRRSRSSNLTSDIISDIPSNILDNILICLPIRDAARTSVLSKKWRFKWLYIPQLVFNNYYFYCAVCSKLPVEIWFQIYQILLLHRGPLDRFVLSIPDLVKTDARGVIHQIISFLIGKDIQKLTLCAQSAFEYRLPSALFQCMNLTHLNLSDCVIRLPPEFGWFKRIISVELVKVRLSDNDLNAFISKCPLLQELKLAIKRRGRPVVIDAPKLKFLEFSCPRSIVFTNVPVLSTVVIKDYGRGWSDQSSNMVTMFGSLPAIEHLFACHDFIRHLSTGNLQDRLPTMLNHLQYVDLSELRFHELKEFQSALLLIKSSPNLQKLKIKCPSLRYDKEGDTVATLQFCIALHSVESFNQLHEVTMEDFNGTASEMEFLTVILAKSSLLRKIIIRPKEIFSRKVLPMMAAVTRLRRTSPEAEIIFFLGDLIA